MMATAVPSHWIRPRRVDTRRGTRSGMCNEYQLVCGVGEFELDIVVREYRELFETMGQVTSGGSIYQPVANLDVQLVTASGECKGSANKTDQFGEFDARSDWTGPIGIRLGKHKDAPCVLLREEQA